MIIPNICKFVEQRSSSINTLTKLARIKIQFGKIEDKGIHLSKHFNICPFKGVGDTRQENLIFLRSIYRVSFLTGPPLNSFISSGT